MHKDVIQMPVGLICGARFWMEDEFQRGLPDPIKSSTVETKRSHLVDEELELKNSGSALMLTEAVHPRPSQSDDVTKSRIYIAQQQQQRQQQTIKAQ